jgi:hypothetical protein
MTASENEPGLPLHAPDSATSKEQPKAGMALDLDLLRAIDDDLELLDVPLLGTLQQPSRGKQEDRNSGEVEALEIEVCCRVLDDVAMVEHLAREGQLFAVLELGLCRKLGTKASRLRMKLAPARIIGANRKCDRQSSE